MTLKRLDNTGIVVESLDAVIPFFVELGLRLVFVPALTLSPSSAQ